MISITLNFKSIEAARAALLEIPLSVLAGGEDSKQAAEVKPAKTAKPAKQEPVQEAAPAPEVTAEPQAAEAPTEAPTAVDYTTLQKAVFALAALNREAVIATAGSFGVKTFKELDQSKWAAALEAVQAKVAELKAAA